ncbi:PREDICTED: uncharacterized protein LOC109155085 [Ipomoea nil]|uniref:uncharacterized protein LOC109155085 n=1 Tax=Ipomoea nil TaxID=35883 RepID=UPI00090198B6|nr:PREDICTED: uncharacterized protein LOC109155085 [Ipomoea nil]
MVCWNIWSLRNNIVWNNQRLESARSLRNNIVWNNQRLESASSLIFKTKTYYAAWLAATTDKQQNQRNIAAVDRWIKPQQGFMKLNVDAAINKEESCMGFGCVLRDDQGCFVAARGAKWRGTYMAKEAEAMAIRESLTWLKYVTLNKVVIEFDSLQVVQNYHSTSGNSYFHVILGDIKNLMSLFAQSSLVFTKRSANQAAHLLAAVCFFV